MNAGIEVCEAAVVAQLEKITVANGYRSDVAKVYRVPLNADQPPSGNNLAVIPMPDALSFRPMDAEAYEFKDTLIVGGMVTIGTADLMDPERAIRTNRLLEDAWDCLQEDPHFGFRGQLDTVLEIGDRGVDSDRGFGYFSLRLHLTYVAARRTMP